MPAKYLESASQMCGNATSDATVSSAKCIIVSFDEKINASVSRASRVPPHVHHWGKRLRPPAGIVILTNEHSITLAHVQRRARASFHADHLKKRPVIQVESCFWRRRFRRRRSVCCVRTPQNVKRGSTISTIPAGTSFPNASFHARCVASAIHPPPTAEDVMRKNNFRCVYVRAPPPKIETPIATK